MQAPVNEAAAHKFDEQLRNIPGFQIHTEIVPRVVDAQQHALVIRALRVDGGAGFIHQNVFVIFGNDRPGLAHHIRRLRQQHVLDRRNGRTGEFRQAFHKRFVKEQEGAVHQLLLGGKVMVKRADGNARFGTDLLDFCLFPTLAFYKHPRRLQDARLREQGPFRIGVCRHRIHTPSPLIIAHAP